MDGGWVLEQSALALQDDQKDTYYILHYIVEPFLYKKQKYKVVDYLKIKIIKKI